MDMIIEVQAFDMTWSCEAFVDSEGAILEAVTIGGQRMNSSLLAPRVRTVLELDCWAAAQKKAA